MSCLNEKLSEKFNIMPYFIMVFMPTYIVEGNGYKYDMRFPSSQEIHVLPGEEIPSDSLFLEAYRLVGLRHLKLK